jgi:truncated hemoglobin YjbI
MQNIHPFKIADTDQHIVKELKPALSAINLYQGYRKSR